MFIISAKNREKTSIISNNNIRKINFKNNNTALLCVLKITLLIRELLLFIMYLKL
jgi:hypothetical protein